MAEKISKTAKRSTGKVIAAKKRMCSKCGTAEAHVVKYTGYGPLRGFYWTCEAGSCGFTEPSRA